MNLLSALQDFFTELKKEGVSKGDVASKIGVSPGYISKILSGEKPVTDSFTGALHKHYGLILKKVGINLRKDFDNEQKSKHVTWEEEAGNLDVRKQSLEKSIENLTQNELRTTAIIERLVELLEKQYGSTGLMAPPGTPGTETLNPRKQKANKE